MKPNDKNKHPVLTVRITRETMDAIDGLAADAGSSRAAVAERLLVKGINRADVLGIVEGEQAVARAARDVRAHLMASVRDELIKLMDKP